MLGRMQLAPLLGVNNLWDRRYIGSVTLNGAGGRVFEPAPRRVDLFRDGDRVPDSADRRASLVQGSEVRAQPV